MKYTTVLPIGAAIVGGAAARIAARHGNGANIVRLPSSTLPPAATTSPARPATTGSGSNDLSSWTNIGCYADLVQGVHIWSSFSASDEMTHEMCATTCAGYNYFGVEYGRECYCGWTRKKDRALLA